MARTAEAHRRQMARKRQKREDKSNVAEWQVWRTCDLCEEAYCANNYADRKVRVKKWHGLEVCAFCINRTLKGLPRLMELKIVKFTKKHQV